MENNGGSMDICDFTLSAVKCEFSQNDMEAESGPCGVDTSNFYERVNNKRKIGPPCKDGCYEKLGLDNVEVIFGLFWALGSFSEQNEYIAHHVKSVDPKRVRVRDKPSRKSRTISYSVTINNNTIPVCRLAFYGIHAITERRVRAVIGKVPSSEVKLVDSQTKPRKLRITQGHDSSKAQGNELRNPRDAGYVADLHISELGRAPPICSRPPQHSAQASSEIHDQLLENRESFLNSDASAHKGNKLNSVNGGSILVKPLEELVQMPNPSSWAFDEFDAFGKIVAVHLRQLPLNFALECQSEITQYLINKRLGQRTTLDINSSVQPGQSFSAPSQSSNISTSCFTNGLSERL